MITLHSFIPLCAKCFQIHDHVRREIKNLGSELEQIWFQGWFCPTGFIIFLSVPQLPPLWNGCLGKDVLSPYLKPISPRLGFWQLWDKQGLVPVYWRLWAIVVCLSVSSSRQTPLSRACRTWNQRMPRTENSKKKIGFSCFKGLSGL